MAKKEQIDAENQRDETFQDPEIEKFVASRTHQMRKNLPGKSVAARIYYKAHAERKIKQGVDEGRLIINSEQPQRP